jgi:hypothetical protein
MCPNRHRNSDEEDDHPRMLTSVAELLRNLRRHPEDQSPRQRLKSARGQLSATWPAIRIPFRHCACWPNARSSKAI